MYAQFYTRDAKSAYQHIAFRLIALVEVRLAYGYKKLLRALSVAQDENRAYRVCRILRDYADTLDTVLRRLRHIYERVIKVIATFVPPSETTPGELTGIRLRKCRRKKYLNYERVPSVDKTTGRPAMFPDQLISFRDTCKTLPDELLFPGEAKAERLVHECPEEAERQLEKYHRFSMFSRDAVKTEANQRRSFAHYLDVLHKMLIALVSLEFEDQSIKIPRTGLEIMRNRNYFRLRFEACRVVGLPLPTKRDRKFYEKLREKSDVVQYMPPPRYPPIFKVVKDRTRLHDERRPLSPVLTEGLSRILNRSKR